MTSPDPTADAPSAAPSRGAGARSPEAGGPVPPGAPARPEEATPAPAGERPEDAARPVGPALRAAALRAALGGGLGALAGAAWAWGLRDTFPSALGPLLLGALLVGLSGAIPAAVAGWVERRGWGPGRAALAVALAGAAGVVGPTLDAVYVAGLARSGAEGGLDALVYLWEEARTREGALVTGAVAGLALGHGLVPGLVVRRRRLGQPLGTVLGRSLLEGLALAAALLLLTFGAGALLFQRGPPPAPLGVVVGLGLGAGLYPAAPGVVVAPLWALLLAAADRLEARR